VNFVDTAKVVVKAGSGGIGAVSFRHEKFIDKGGPDGGDGVDGGNVIFVASESENTLANFRFQKELAAEDGASGGKNRRHGKNGEDLLVKLPVGTQILASGELAADLVASGEQALIASGGRGGFGNAHFTSSTRQAPKFAEYGEPGEVKTLALELKMIADVGLIGLPNADKSTLLAKLSNARPEIADYPFTTLTPNLGVVDVNKNASLLLADIPGLIEGASAGKGLGHEFLKHVERTAVLVHLIDAYQPDIASAYQTIQKELAGYSGTLATKPQILALNKTEGLTASDTSKLASKLRKLAPKSTKVLAISASSGKNLDQLVAAASAAVKAYRRREQPASAASELPVITLADTSASFRVEKTASGFKVTGRKIDQFASRTDFANDQAVARLKDIMRKQGILHELARQGAKPGQAIGLKSGNLRY
jgi:GTP-binding protein